MAKPLLTIEQAKTLSRMAEEFILVFDSDAAGSTASERSIDMLREVGIYPKIGAASIEMIAPAASANPNALPFDESPTADFI